MKRVFDVEVTVSQSVRVEIDDASFDEAAMAEFRKSFYDLNTLEEHAEHIAQYIVRFGEDSFIEGYGAVKYRGDWIDSRYSDRAFHDINVIPGPDDVETEATEVKGGEEE